jgi:hypothetical protein
MDAGFQIFCGAICTDILHFLARVLVIQAGFRSPTCNLHLPAQFRYLEAINASASLIGRVGLSVLLIHLEGAALSGLS